MEFVRLVQAFVQNSLIESHRVSKGLIPHSPRPGLMLLTAFLPFGLAEHVPHAVIVPQLLFRLDRDPCAGCVCRYWSRRQIFRGAGMPNDSV